MIVRVILYASTFMLATRHGRPLGVRGTPRALRLGAHFLSRIRWTPQGHATDAPMTAHLTPIGRPFWRHRDTKWMVFGHISDFVSTYMPLIRRLLDIHWTSI
ncbi:PREDICTED: uncharacterized protein LOC105556284 [Vollenhovia emeryi]|uniref:uncharacterized protein LOC105556284 n=1 Tax=Vollenhovia emeryi TaxID=411798 RepID=UPI0005F4EA47|nr:PREDICTED: uncharacterized protein LOC105556284 [Vollenhovia emeryi]